MITIHNRHRILGRDWWTTEWSGLSTDDKGAVEEARVNDLLFEMDTKDFYYCVSGFVKGEQTYIVPSMKFTATMRSANENTNYYFYPFDADIPDDALNVVFDGVTYTVEWDYGVLGAPYNDRTDRYDFSTYPFAITEKSIYDEATDDYYVKWCVFVPDDEEHSLEIYIDVGDTPAVWEKVGSGGSEPTGTKLFEGNVTTANYGGDIYYEFNPVLALNYSSLIVEFEGTKYTVSKLSNEDGVFEFGDSLMNWSEYPFNLYYNKNDELQSLVSTESAGTYSLKIWANSEPIDTEPLIPVGGDMNS